MVTLAWGEGSVPFDLALGSLDLPEAEHHQAHIGGIGSDANDAEITENEEQDPGQGGRTSERHQGTQLQQIPRGPGRNLTTAVVCRRRHQICCWID